MRIINVYKRSKNCIVWCSHFSRTCIIPLFFCILNLILLIKFWHQLLGVPLSCNDIGRNILKDQNCDSLEKIIPLSQMASSSDNALQKPFSLTSKLSIPESCIKTLSSKIENLIEYSYVPEDTQIESSIPPLLSPCNVFRREKRSFRWLRKKLISTSKPGVLQKWMNVLSKPQAPNNTLI